MNSGKSFLCKSLAVMLVSFFSMASPGQASPVSDQPILVAQSGLSQSYFERASEAADQKAQAQVQLNQVKNDEQSVSAQIEKLTKLRQAHGSAASAAAEEKQMYVLQKALANDKAYEARDLATISSLDQWINYWVTLNKSTVSWDQSQENQAWADRIQHHLDKEAVRKEQAQTEDGTNYWKAINTPASGGSLVNPVDGWNTIALPSR